MKTLNINMLFSILSVGLGTYGTICVVVGKPWTFIQKNNRFSCILSMLYFSYDTVNEYVVYNRLFYIPHHLISLLIAYKFYVLKDIAMIKAGPILQLCGEGTTLIVNIRENLKKKKKLTTKMDCIFLSTYMVIRNGVITPCLYMNCANNPEIWYGWLGIFAMSNIWGFMWANSIIKYRLKTNKSN